MVTSHSTQTAPLPAIASTFNGLTCACGSRCGYLFAGLRCLDCAASLLAAEEERDEARDVARQLLGIARHRGPELFGVEMYPWLKEDDGKQR